MAHRHHGGHGGQSLSHLLAFTPPPRPPPASGGRRPHPSRAPGAALGRERRVHVQPQLRFLLDPTPRRESEYVRALAEPDVPVPWDSVVAVAFVSSPPLPDAAVSQHAFGAGAAREALPVCPICLSPPTAPRIARCGHIFCLPCLLHHLSPDPDPDPPAARPSPAQIASRAQHARTPRHCPVCWDAVYGADLRPVWVWDEQEAHTTAFTSLDRTVLTGGQQDYACLRLMYRPEGSTIALPLSASWPPVGMYAGADADAGAGTGASAGVSAGATPLPPYTFQPDAVFSRMLRVRPADMLSHLRADLADVEQEREDSVAVVRPTPSPQATPSTARLPPSSTPTSHSPGAPVPYAALARKLLGPQAEPIHEKQLNPDPDGTLTFLDAASAMILSALKDAEATWAAPTGVVHQLAEQARAKFSEPYGLPRPIPATGFTFYQAVGGAPMYLHPVDHSIVERLTHALDGTPYMLLVRLARDRKRTLGGQEDTVVDQPLQRRFRTLAPALGSHLLLLHADWPVGLLDPHAPAVSPTDAAVYMSHLPRPLSEHERERLHGAEPARLLPLTPSGHDLAPYRSALKQRQSANQRKYRAEQVADLHKARSTQRADSELDNVLDPAARVHRHALRQDPTREPGMEGDPDLRRALALSLREAGLDMPHGLVETAAVHDPLAAAEDAELAVSADAQADAAALSDAAVQAETEETYIRSARGPTTVWGTRAVLAGDPGELRSDGWDDAWGSLAAPSPAANGKKAKGKKAKGKAKVLSLTGGGR